MLTNPPLQLTKLLDIESLRISNGSPLSQSNLYILSSICVSINETTSASIYVLSDARILLLLSNQFSLQTIRILPPPLCSKPRILCISATSDGSLVLFITECFSLFSFSLASFCSSLVSSGSSPCPLRSLYTKLSWGSFKATTTTLLSQLSQSTIKIDRFLTLKMIGDVFVLLFASQRVSSNHVINHFWSICVNSGQVYSCKLPQGTFHSADLIDQSNSTSLDQNSREVFCLISMTPKSDDYCKPVYYIVPMSSLQSVSVKNKDHKVINLPSPIIVSHLVNFSTSFFLSFSSGTCSDSIILLRKSTEVNAFLTERHVICDLFDLYRDAPLYSFLIPSSILKGNEPSFLIPLSSILIVVVNQGSNSTIYGLSLLSSIKSASVMTSTLSFSILGRQSNLKPIVELNLPENVYIRNYHVTSSGQNHGPLMGKNVVYFWTNQSILILTEVGAKISLQNLNNSVESSEILSTVDCLSPVYPDILFEFLMSLLTSQDQSFAYETCFIDLFPLISSSNQILFILEYCVFTLENFKFVAKLLHIQAEEGKIEQNVWRNFEQESSEVKRLLVLYLFVEFSVFSAFSTNSINFLTAFLTLDVSNFDSKYLNLYNSIYNFVLIKICSLIFDSNHDTIELNQSFFEIFTHLNITSCIPVREIFTQIFAKNLLTNHLFSLPFLLSLAPSHFIGLISDKSSPNSSLCNTSLTRARAMSITPRSTVVKNREELSQSNFQSNFFPSHIFELHLFTLHLLNFENFGQIFENIQHHCRAFFVFSLAMDFNQSKLIAENFKNLGLFELSSFHFFKYLLSFKNLDQNFELIYSTLLDYSSLCFSREDKVKIFKTFLEFLIELKNWINIEPFELFLSQKLDENFNQNFIDFLEFCIEVDNFPFSLNFLLNFENFYSNRKKDTIINTIDALNVIALR
ncbi:hypothetical protein RCL1_003240 [Eukaryota sp. TZLM3-RCL]